MLYVNDNYITIETNYSAIDYQKVTGIYLYNESLL
ncbi:MAG: hypothetical protein MjAS7_2756 [Metallosphaera javensis (ex Sakai et al. 2022)]|nr:MAG: hypothetical protein MjAS7_2756 [Metallosphaera javensis (ex Sakai et al. 2022)]